MRQPPPPPPPHPRASGDNNGKWTRLRCRSASANHMTTPPSSHPLAPAGAVALSAEQSSHLHKHTHILYAPPPSYGLGAIPGMSKMVSPFVSPLFLPDDGDPLSRDGCGPESHLERLKYNKALPSQRIEHQIKENGGKAWL